MAMVSLVDPYADTRWRQQYRRDLANDGYELALAEAAAQGQPASLAAGTVPTTAAAGKAGESTTEPPPAKTPPPSSQTPGGPVNTNPGGPGPGAGSGNAPTTPPPGNTPSKPTFGTTPYTDRGSGAITGAIPFTGFDFQQDPNNRLIGKSAKYTLAQAVQLAANAGVGDIWKTKEGAQYFAENYIKPYFEQHGFEVLQIVGDKMFVRDYTDRAAGKPGRWVDWVVNAGGESQGLTPQIAWQPETGPQTNEPSTYDTTRFGQRSNIEGLNQFTPASPTAATTAGPRAGMTPDERAYEMLQRREERRMSRLFR